VLLEPLELYVDPILTEIGYRHNRRTGNHGYAMDGASAAGTHTNACHAHPLHGLEREALHRRTTHSKKLERIA
jgi:hypothetical protein